MDFAIIIKNWKSGLGICPADVFLDNFFTVPPRVIVPDSERVVTVAETVILSCSVGGDPLPDIYWTKNGRSIQLGNRIQQLANGSLVIFDSTVIIVFLHKKTIYLTFNSLINVNLFE